MKRACQRQTAVLLTPAVRIIAAVPSLSAVANTIRARQTCFCALLRLSTIARSRGNPTKDSYVGFNPLVYRSRQESCRGVKRHRPGAPCSSGKSAKAVQPCLKKYFAFQTGRLNPIRRLVLSREEGRIAIVTDAGGDAVDAAASGAKRQSQGRSHDL
jgi:hypothetical protein